MICGDTRAKTSIPRRRTDDVDYRQLDNTNLCYPHPSGGALRTLSVKQRAPWLDLLSLKRANYACSAVSLPNSDAEEGISHKIDIQVFNLELGNMKFTYAHLWPYVSFALLGFCSSTQ